MWVALVYLLFDVPNILRWLQVLLGSTVPSSVEFDIVNVAILLLLSLTAVIGNIGFLGMYLEKANRQAIALAAQQARSEESANLMSQISQLDRRRSIGELAASLSHELSQPLNNIHLIAQTLEQQTLQRSVTDEKLSLFIQKILANFSIANAILQKIREFIQNKNIHQQHERLNLQQLLTNSISLLEDSFNKEKIRLSVRVSDPELCVSGNAVQLAQIMINILRNGMQATHGQQVRLMDVQVQTTSDQVLVRFTDNGPGFSTESLEKAGQAFFTTKPDGLGLGLSICQGIAEQHQGQIQTDNSPHGGALVTLQLPLHA
jgi:signal transduction histidine kinase